jgi:PAS fold
MDILQSDTAGGSVEWGPGVADSSVGVAVCDRNLRFLTVNLAMARMHGVPYDKHLGRRIRDVLGRRAKRLEQACERVIETGQSLSNLTFSEKWRGRKRMGHWMTTLCPIKNLAGAVESVGFLVVEIPDRAAVYLSPGDGRLIDPLEASRCLKRWERAMQKQPELLVEAHRIERESRTAARVPPQHPVRERVVPRPRRYQQFFRF